MRILLNNLLILGVIHQMTAQIPIGYYDPAINHSGTSLKFQLNQIIDNHVEFPYTDTNIDVWDILKVTDRDTNNPDNVILIYSGVSIDASDQFNPINTDGWIREHVWAKSRGSFGTSIGPGTDVHALRPLDVTTNVSRNNRGFNNCTNCEIVYDYWNNDTGSKRDINEYSFEPRDEVKGDVARMLFYMAVRYEGLDDYIDLELTETILPNGDNSPFLGVRSVLLDWHRNDPVDNWERNRNDIIYYSYQQNRNPFIDHPELADHLWGDKTDESWSIPLNMDLLDSLNIQLYLNPEVEALHINGLKDDVEVKLYNVLGQEVLTTSLSLTNNLIDVSGFQGIHLVKLRIGEQTVIKKIFVH